MTTQLRIAPPNSLLLIMDRDSGEIPESMQGRLVVSTPSCIAVGTRSAADGETSIVLTDEQNNSCVEQGLRRVFGGTLETPKREVHICSVLLECLATLSVSSTRSAVEVWTDHDSEPGRICVITNILRTNVGHS
jgi:hypothetical protein